MVPFGKARIHREGSALTIVAWGEMVHRADEAVAKAGVDAEIIDLRTIAPWDKDAVLTSIAKTNRCLIIHEDGLTCGFGAEISATISQEAFDLLDAPVVRMATPDIPIPYNKGMMNVVIPTVDSIAAEISRLTSF